MCSCRSRVVRSTSTTAPLDFLVSWGAGGRTVAAATAAGSPVSVALFGLASFSRRTARARQSWGLYRLLWTATTATSSAATVAVAPLLLRRLFASNGRAGRLRLGRRSRGFRWSFRLRYKIRLPVTVDVSRRGIGKFGLQRSGILLPLLVVLRFAPLAAVAHPSAHVALVTRLPSW